MIHGQPVAEGVIGSSGEICSEANGCLVSNSVPKIDALNCQTNRLIQNTVLLFHVSLVSHFVFKIS